MKTDKKHKTSATATAMRTGQIMMMPPPLIIIAMEITPLILSSSSTTTTQKRPLLTNFSIHHYLQQQTRIKLDLFSPPSSFSISQTKDQETEGVNEKGESGAGQFVVSWKKEKTTTTTSRCIRSGYLYYKNDDEDDVLDVDRAALEVERGEKHDAVAVVPPILYLPSDNPCQVEWEPCWVHIFVATSPFLDQVGLPLVTKSTLVTVLPPSCCSAIQRQSLEPIRNDDPSKNEEDSNTTTVPAPPWFAANEFRQGLLWGRGEDSSVLAKISTTATPLEKDDDDDDDVCRNHNPETVQELEYRLTTMLSKSVFVGTTPDALDMYRKRKRRQTRMKQTLLHQSSSSSPPSTASSPIRPAVDHHEPSFSSLIVHSPLHGHGKTMLVKAIAKQACGCQRIHVIEFPFFLARFGSRADAALESHLHSLVMQAAVRHESVTILLDHLDAFLPPRFSSSTSNGVGGDAALPVLNAVASYLKRLTSSLSKQQEFPFPVQSPLYQTAHTNGHILKVNMCLVGVVTCPDDGWKSGPASASYSSPGSDGTSNISILDCMVGGRYRISPYLSAATRFTAFQSAFHKHGIALKEESALVDLRALAASATWAIGSSFDRIARQVCDDSRSSVPSQQSINKDDTEGVIGASHLIRRAFRLVQSERSELMASVLCFDTTVDDETVPKKQDSTAFNEVGGNLSAKQALEDALVLDPKTRQVMKRFGLAPPTGILLYGPPGTGKTLLARGVATILRGPKHDQSVSHVGAFISITATDLVRAEVGTGEKMLASVFETAMKNAPSVIFLDEFQAIFTERSRGGSGKLATTLLQCLDDVRRQSALENASTTGKSRVLVLAATNTPWMVDSAFLRPGRFDKVVHVGLPDNLGRESILGVLLSRMKLTPQVHNDIENVCRDLGVQTAGFSGADLAALCYAAAIAAISDSVAGERTFVEKSHFQKAIEHDVRASSDEELVRRLLSWHP